MNPEVFLFLSLLTDRYYFMEALTKNRVFSSVDIIYDKQEKAFYRGVVYNADYTNKEPVYLKSMPISKEIPNRMILEAPELVSAYKKGQLKGHLKEIAANMTEESNPVIMLMKYKK